ncbi:MAG: MBL fold metallo-hydrolase [Calditrichia bacterium]
MKIGKLHIEGNSSSAFATFIGVKELDVLFDVGHCPPHFIRYNNLLITHGHQDHLLSLTRYIGLRNMNGMPSPTIFFPSVQEQNIKDLLELWSKIERRKNYDVRLVPVDADNAYDINDKFYFKVFKTPHSFDSVGYVVYEKRKKLKEEYLHLPASEIIRLKSEGKEIEYHKHIPHVCFTGDTTEEIIENPIIQEADYLIMEATFLSDDHLAAADDKAHIHLNKIIDFIQNTRNKYIILTHFSMRYNKKDAESIIKEILGPLYQSKVFIL